MTMPADGKTEAYFVTGTGTEIGKTHMSALFVRDALRAGKRVAYVKPVQTGHPPDDDAAVVREFVARECGPGFAPGGADADRLTTMTLYVADEPVAPCFVLDRLRAKADHFPAGVTPQAPTPEAFPIRGVADAVRAVLDAGEHDLLLVESAGGLLVPLDETRTNADLARTLGLPLLAVVPNRLGCIHDAAQLAYYVEREGLPFAGFLVNDHFASSEVNRLRNREWIGRHGAIFE